MFGGRIEMPLEEYNAMKSKIDDYEKVINNISGDASRFKEENEALKSALSDIVSAGLTERLFKWRELKQKVEHFLSVE